MPDEALLLSEAEPLTGDASRAAAVLLFFGIRARSVLGSKSFLELASRLEPSDKARVIGSADNLLKLVQELESSADGRRLWQEHVHSAFVYAGSDATLLVTLIKRLTGESGPLVAKVVESSDPWCISESLSWFCGPMSGVKVQKAGGDLGLDCNKASGKITPIISASQLSACVKIDYHGVPIFVSSCPEVIDLEAQLTKQNFDIRDHFLSAVPLVMYVKWAFAGTCWSAPEFNACLVIDDPLLKRRYGFIRFQRLLSLMEQHRFSTNIAFIPWNWRRSAPGVIRLFKDHPEKYSLSVHGCDHTAAEFGSSDPEWLAFKVEQAVDRMNRHELKTGVTHGRIMVFPQGVFSSASAEALKRANFLAAVNTEVFSADVNRPAIKVEDVWDIALMGYHSFPIFTRRYPAQGVENFAFDLLLGKPCIIVIHHDFCHDECRSLVAFIEKLNALNCTMTWRSLEEVVRRSSRQRELEPDAVDVEMYGNQLLLNNQSQRNKRFVVRKRESDHPAISDITVASRPIGWSSSDGYVIFDTTLAAGEQAIVQVTYRDPIKNGRSTEALSYRLKTGLRRYLSEARDNYIVPGKSRLARMFKHAATS